MPRSRPMLTAAAWWMPSRIRRARVPIRRASVALACPSVAVALRSCRTQGRRLEPKDHCIQRMRPGPR
jgi:hypothetical protein